MIRTGTVITFAGGAGWPFSIVFAAGSLFEFKLWERVMTALFLIAISHVFARRMCTCRIVGSGVVAFTSSRFLYTSVAKHHTNR